MHLLPLALLLVVSAALSCAINAILEAKKCPPAEIIQPCTCGKNSESESIYIECKNLKTPDTLEDVFSRMPNWCFKDLSIINSSILYIPSSIFLNASFENISIIDSSLITMFDKPPYSESLKEIKIHNVMFERGVDWSLFTKLTIERMKLNGTTVKKLGQSFREGVPETLEVLDLTDSSITHISPHTFITAKKLWSLRITHGLLKKLDYDIFPKTIVDIRLDYNLIEALPDGIFKDLPCLDLVSLEGNLLTLIQKEVFLNVKTLVLYNNPVNCDCSLRWILTSEINMFGTCINPSTARGNETHYLTENDFSYCG